MAHSKMSPKRKVNVRGQKHSLAYINDREKRLLRKHGGSGKPGPNGIPTYDDLDEGYGEEDMGGAAGGDPGTGGGFASDDIGGGFGGGSGDDNNNGGEDQPTPAEMARARASTKKVSTPVPMPSPARAPDERTKAQREINARIDRLDRFSKDDRNNYLSKKMAQANVLGAKRVSDKLNEAGSIPIRNTKGEVVGVMHQGPFGLGMVYSGRSLSKAEYAGPAEFANNVVFDPGEGESDNVRAGAKEKKSVEIVDGKLPDAPKAGDGDDTERRSKMGKESTISTTAQGLLGLAKTRNRSLMAGLIS